MKKTDESVFKKPSRPQSLKQWNNHDNEFNNIAFNLIINRKLKMYDIPVDKMSILLMQNLFYRNAKYFREFYNMENLLRIIEIEEMNNTHYLDKLFVEISSRERLCIYLINIIPEFVAQISYEALTQEMVRIAYQRMPELRNHFDRIGVKIVD